MFKSVAIDGPAGAGKSTISKIVAKNIGYVYVDTGSLYRAISYYMDNNGLDVTNEEVVINSLDKIDIKLQADTVEQKVILNGEDVTKKLHTPRISKVTAKVAAIPQVREFLFSLQKDVTKTNNIIMDGRDIGTVVLPNADVKIYLTASPEERAKRRQNEFIVSGKEFNFDEVLAQIIERDNQDMSRELSPLKQAEDAILVDTSDINLEQSIKKLSDIIKEKLSIIE